jgi:hypothetical protein
MNKAANQTCLANALAAEDHDLGFNARVARHDETYEMRWSVYGM